jgi:hypothetical protein
MVHAVLGLIFFFLLNLGAVLLLVILSFSSSDISDFLNSATGTAAYGLTILLLNIGLLIYFGFTRYWVALGALIVCSIWFVFVLLMAPQCFGLNPIVVNRNNGVYGITG